MNDGFSKKSTGETPRRSNLRSDGRSGSAAGKRPLATGLNGHRLSAAPEPQPCDPAAEAVQLKWAAMTRRWMPTAMRPDLNPAPMQRAADSATGDMGQGLPSDGAGKPMPENVQAKMEGAFGADFSAVRIHEGPRSEALGALAFTQGTDVHFAPGQYQPGSQSGQALLGHELAHVVQQSQGRVSATTQAKGVAVNDDTGLEAEADEMGAKAARGEKVSEEGGSGRLDRAEMSASHDRKQIQRQASPLVVQRRPKNSHYGTFTDSTYEFNAAQDELEMELLFRPNDQADATKVGLTQTVKAVRAGTTTAIDPNSASRMTSDGHRIDRLSDRPNPIYATNATPTSPGSQNDLGGYSTSSNGAFAEKQGDGTWTDAKIKDTPTVDSNNDSQKEFESAAVAVEGPQSGTYYGSVKWGWERDSSGTLTKIPFDLVSQGVPSNNFLEAAETWNNATTRGTYRITANPANVYDYATSTTITLAQGTRIRQTKTVSVGTASMIRAEVLNADGTTNAGQIVRVRIEDAENWGDGGATVDLPTVDVKVTCASITLEQPIPMVNLTLPANTRIAVVQEWHPPLLAGEIRVVDGPHTGATGRVSFEQWGNWDSE